MSFHITTIGKVQLRCERREGRGHRDRLQRLDVGAPHPEGRGGREEGNSWGPAQLPELRRLRHAEGSLVIPNVWGTP